MKKYIIYIGILVIGLLLGWVLFGDSSNKEMEHNHDKASEVNQMWTCSMHPQIMKPEPGDCPICGMDLIPTDSGNDGLAKGQFKMTKNAMALANIQTTVVGYGDVDNDVLRLSGKITENEDEIATQPAHFNGRIDRLYINSLGEKVKIGQAIAEVYSPELIAAQQELITAYKIRESQPLLYQAVRNKFKNWKIHDSQLSEVEASGKVKTAFTIYSHISGIITTIMVTEGAHITDGRAIFKTANLNTVWASFDAYENQVSLLKKGQNIKIVTKAYPDKTFDAKISFINPVLNSSTRTVEVRAVLQNPKGQLKPGMFVVGSLELVSNKKNETMVIPESAVLWTGERSVVYIKRNPNDPTFEMREIMLGDAINGGYVVLSGLENGEEIVTNGTFTIDAAAQLKGKNSMMNNEGSKVMTGHEGH